jgi:HD-GYP domain-containing protein (c-di-GMP phosphodiesterase class II)
VIGVAEVFDALTTSRPYQEAMEPDRAIEHMGSLVGAIIGAEDFEAMRAVATRRQALVFLEDDTEKAYPAGIPDKTLRNYPA